MPLSRSRDYLSIGEVLETIQAEFPDISISKIRFLESEGLISPERTRSGYRKFYDHDVARLRYILALQRDHFMPLRVIRERLAQADADGGVPVVPPASPVAPAAPAEAQSQGRDGAPAVVGDLVDVNMDRAEFRGASGLSEAQLGELEEFGVLEGTGDGSFSGNDLVMAKAAKGFLDRGLGARHLKMYKQFAEREATMFEQMVGPVALRRDPQARKQASGSISQLASLARQMHDAVLRSRVQDLL